MTPKVSEKLNALFEISPKQLKTFHSNLKMQPLSNPLLKCLILFILNLFTIIRSCCYAS